MKQRLEKLMAEYGPVAAATYFSIFGIVICGFALAIQLGLEVEGVAGSVGTWGAAWLATKITQPLRIAATFALTPLLARLLRRRKTAPVAVEGSVGDSR